MPSKFCRPSASVQKLPVVPPIDRTAFLNQVQRLINEGMCVSALVLATDAGQQFNASTLRAWASETRSDALYRRRRTYAYLAAHHVPAAEPEPVQPVPITRPPRPVPTYPTPPIPAAHRRYRFVRVPSKVAC